MVKFLIDGKIPANIECIYKEQCPIYLKRQCNHDGVWHDAEYSCTSAILINLINEKKKEKQK